MLDTITLKDNSVQITFPNLDQAASFSRRFWDRFGDVSVDTERDRNGWIREINDDGLRTQAPTFYRMGTPNPDDEIVFHVMSHCGDLDPTVADWIDLLLEQHEAEVAGVEFNLAYANALDVPSLAEMH